MNLRLWAFWWMILFALLLVACAHQEKTTTVDKAAHVKTETQAQATEKVEAASEARVEKKPKRVIHLRPDRTPWKIEEDDGESSSTVTNSSKLSSLSTTAKAEGDLDVNVRTNEKIARRWFAPAVAGVLAAILVFGVVYRIGVRYDPRRRG